MKVLTLEVEFSRLNLPSPESGPPQIGSALPQERLAQTAWGRDPAGVAYVVLDIISGRLWPCQARLLHMNRGICRRADIRQAAKPLASVNRPCIESVMEIANASASSGPAANRIHRIMTRLLLITTTWQAMEWKVEWWPLLGGHWSIWPFLSRCNPIVLCESWLPSDSDFPCSPYRFFFNQRTARQLTRTTSSPNMLWLYQFPCMRATQRVYNRPLSRCCQWSPQVAKAK